MKKFLNPLKFLKRSKKVDNADQAAAPKLPVAPAQEDAKFQTLLQRVSSVFSNLTKKNKVKGPKKKKTKNPSKHQLFDFDINEISNKLFSTSLRAKLHKISIIALAIATAYSVGKITAIIAKGKTVVKPTVSSNLIIPKTFTETDYEMIKITDLFSANKDSDKDKKLQNTGPLIDRTKICMDAKVQSNLPITLLNTIVLQDSVKSVASVQLRSKKDPSKIREGEIVEGMAQVGKISRLKLIFKNLSNGRCEYVSNEKMRARSKNVINVLSPEKSREVIKQINNKDIVQKGNKFQIKKKFLNDKLQDIGTILTQARAIQVNNPDGSISFRLQEIEPGSIYTALDLRNNDTITEINGNKISNINQVMDLFGKIRNLSQLQLTIKRDGMDKKVDYSLND